MVMALSAAHIGFALCVVLVLFVVQKLLCGGAPPGLGNTVLVLGDIGAGKTVLVRKLLSGSVPKTRTSMKEVAFSNVTLQREEGGSGAGAGEGGVLNVVDFPGHPRLRSGVAARLAQASVVLFVVDSSDLTKAHLGTCAEFLYDVMTNESVEARQPALLVVCSKSDLGAAAAKAYVRTQLEKELSRLKETRPSLAAEGDDGGADTILLGRKGKDFTFAEDCPCETRFCEFTALPAAGADGGLREVEVFIRDFIQ